MSRVDDFESVFRSAIKETFSYAPPDVSTGLLISDEEADDPAVAETLRHVKTMFAHGHGDVDWQVVARPTVRSTRDALSLIDERKPNVIACRRHTFGIGRGLHHSLGSAVDTFTQACEAAVLLLPDDMERLETHSRAERVLVVTDHLTGDDVLVNWGAHLCSDQGTLFLAHIEDVRTFERYASTIGKLPRLETEDTIRRIHDKLLAEPTEYIESTAAVLKEAGIGEDIEAIVRMGHAVSDYKALAEDKDIDILVMDTQDASQLAMQGLAYALAVEVRGRPLLLL